MTATMPDHTRSRVFRRRAGDGYADGWGYHCGFCTAAAAWLPSQPAARSALEEHQETCEGVRREPEYEEVYWLDDLKTGLTILAFGAVVVIFILLAVWYFTTPAYNMPEWMR